MLVSLGFLMLLLRHINADRPKKTLLKKTLTIHCDLSFILLLLKTISPHVRMYYVAYTLIHP